MAAATATATSTITTIRPILVAGRGGGTIKTGRHVRLAGETPVTNLWASLLERMDVRVPFIGDSTGSLTVLNSV